MGWCLYVWMCLCSGFRFGLVSVCLDVSVFWCCWCGLMYDWIRAGSWCGLVSVCSDVSVFVFFRFMLVSVCLDVSAFVVAARVRVFIIGGVCAWCCGVVPHAFLSGAGMWGNDSIKMPP